jgi:predicted transcriptional regulator
MEKLCDLYFELSNEERLKILYLLNEKPNTLTGLSDELGIRNQQCSRHLTRLTENGLIRKTVEGGYSITEYGSVILRLQPTLDFLTKHSEYFQEHSTIGIPETSLATIGLMKEANIVRDLNLALFTIERIIEESETALYEVTNQFHVNTIKPRNQALKRRVKLRSIESYDTVMPGAIREWFRTNPDYVTTSYDAREKGLVHEKVVSSLSYLMHMSEKEAFVAFPDINGGFDHIGFTSKDPDFLLWCRTLFDSTWKQSPLKGKKIKDIYIKVVDNESICKALLDFSGENQLLVDMGLSVGSDLTVIGEAIKLYVNRGVPSSSIDPETYWKQMR